MKYLTNFNTLLEYENTLILDVPNTSYIMENKIVKYSEYPKVGSKYIIYKSNNGSEITPYSPTVFGASLISNKYDDFGLISFNDSVTSIGSNAFQWCSSLTSITLPDSATLIGDRAFNNCSSLTSVTIGNSITSIGRGAFGYCSSLTSITIPNTVTNIEYEAFYGCSSLTSITWNAENCSDFLGKRLESHFFYDIGSQITKFVFGDEVQHIPSYLCYKMNNLSYIIIPTSVTSIGNSAFNNCSSLTSVSIGAGVTSIGNSAFSGCHSLTSITIPNSVISIGDYAFNGCSALTSVTIPNKVTSIGKSTFSLCHFLTYIVVEKGNTTYDSREQCNAIIETATNTLISGCQNTIIPDSVTSIGDSAFDGCSSLTSIVIPESVTNIGWGAFANCSHLTSIICEATTPPTLGSFNNLSSVTAVYVPALSVDIYKAEDNWSYYASKIQPIHNNLKN